MTLIRMSMFVVVFIVLVADSGNGFTVGPPPLPSVCKTMSPQHHDYKAQTGESPFTVSIDRKETAGGQSVFGNWKNSFMKLTTE